MGSFKLGYNTANSFSKNRGNMLKQYLYNLSFLFTFIIITFISFLPNYNHLPDIASFSDYLNHFTAFFVLSFLFHKAYNAQNQQIFLYLFIYGCSIEIIQYFLPNRVFGLDDILVDSLGIFVYILLAQRFPFCKL